MTKLLIRLFAWLKYLVSIPEPEPEITQPEPEIVHELVFQHTAPLSIDEAMRHFNELGSLLRWFCDRGERGKDGILFLGWGQDHYVTWELEPNSLPHTLTIIQQFMGDPSLETTITVQFTPQDNGTHIVITQRGDITPRMEREYRIDWHGIQYVGFPEKRPQANWGKWR